MSSVYSGCSTARAGDRPRARQRVPRGRCSGETVQAEDLAVEEAEILCSVVAAAGPRVPSRVGTGVAGRHVQVAVGADVEIAAVVVAVDRGDVVDQHLFAREVDDVARHHECAHPVDTPAGCTRCGPRVEDVDTTGLHERGVAREAEQATFAAGTDRQLRRRRREELTRGGFDQSDPAAVLLEHDDPSVRQRFDASGRRNRRDERVGETRRLPGAGSIRWRTGHEHGHEQGRDHGGDDEPTHGRKLLDHVP